MIVGRHPEKGDGFRLPHHAIYPIDTCAVAACVNDVEQGVYHSYARHHLLEEPAPASARLGLGCRRIGSMFDDEVNEIIGVDGAREGVVYMSVVGRHGMYV